MLYMFFLGVERGKCTLYRGDWLWLNPIRPSQKKLKIRKKNSQKFLEKCMTSGIRTREPFTYTHVHTIGHYGDTGSAN